MTASVEITLDSLEPEASASFWLEALGYEHLYTRPPYIVIGPPAGDTRPRLVIQQVDQMSDSKTPVHIDLRVDDLEAEVKRLQELGAKVEWVIEETWTGWTTMSDPQGLLFCVCPARD